MNIGHNLITDFDVRKMWKGIRRNVFRGLKPAKVECKLGDAQGAVATLTCTADAAAIYVVLTTAAHGRFEPNAFPLIGGSREVRFLSWNGTADVDLLKSTLRIDHAGKWPLTPPAVSAALVSAATVQPPLTGTAARRSRPQKREDPVPRPGQCRQDHAPAPAEG